MHTEIKYLNLLAPRLPLFKQKKNRLWNFRCPICNDSQKHKNKARAFVFEARGNLIFKCHNCQSSMSLPHLIEKIDCELHKQYVYEKFTETKQQKAKANLQKITKVVSAKPVFKTNVLGTLSKITDLNTAHPARTYLTNRQIPLETLYYTSTFKAWTNSVKPNTFESIKQDEGRIVIPLLDKDGTFIGYQGRTLNPNSPLRYITILLNEIQSLPKIFGLERLDYTRTIYITEGPFDSLLLDNSIAMSGSSLADCEYLDNCSCVFVFDNEPRNRAITDTISKLVEAGESVVIWPPYISEKYKDVNDMHLAGYDVKKIVREHHYKGLLAKLLFNQWKK